MIEKYLKQKSEKLPVTDNEISEALIHSRDEHREKALDRLNNSLAKSGYRIHQITETETIAGQIFEYRSLVIERTHDFRKINKFSIQRIRDLISDRKIYNPTALKEPIKVAEIIADEEFARLKLTGEMLPGFIQWEEDNLQDGVEPYYYSGPIRILNVNEVRIAVLSQRTYHTWHIEDPETNNWQTMNHEYLNLRYVLID